MILSKDHFARNESNALFTGGGWESEIKTVGWEMGVSDRCLKYDPIVVFNLV